MNRLPRIKLAALLLLFGLYNAATAEVSLNTDDSGVLIHGYDPVSYFDGEPKRGNSALNTEYQGVKVYFSSDSNLYRFQASPERYMPSYGGFCSYGVSMGQKFDIDPEAYHVEGEQLYLLLDRSTKALWDMQREHNIGIADRIWNSIRDVPSGTLAENQ